MGKLEIWIQTQGSSEVGRRAWEDSEFRFRMRVPGSMLMDLRCERVKDLLVQVPGHPGLVTLCTTTPVCG